MKLIEPKPNTSEGEYKATFEYIIYSILKWKKEKKKKSLTTLGPQHSEN